MDLGGGTVLLGRYRLDRHLAVGGMGTVWQASDVLLKRVVAVKVMAPQLRLDPVSWERFRREAQYQAALRHPGITEVYDYGEHEGLPFIVMEFLDGGDLYTLLRGNRRGLPAARAVSLAIQAADALAYLHDSGILHRDIKPANLSLARDGQLKVCDFGVAKSQGSASITHAGTRLGTWAYLAPEVWLGEEATASTDLYALGCVLHEILAGQPLFSPSQDETAARQAHLHGEVPPPRGEQPIPQRLAALVGELLNKDPQARPATARDVAEELRAVAAAVWDDGPPAPGHVLNANPPPGASRPAGGSLPASRSLPLGARLPAGGNGGAPAAATIPRTRELPPGYYPADPELLDAGQAGIPGASPVRASPALADSALTGRRALALSGEPRGQDSAQLWIWAARISAWLVFATTVALCAVIADGHLAPEYRLFVLVPAAIYALPGAMAVSRATFSRATPASVTPGNVKSAGGTSASATSTASPGSLESPGDGPASSASSRLGPAATAFVTLWISEAAAILVASHVRPAEAWSAIMVVAWLAAISTAVYYSS